MEKMEIPALNHHVGSTERVFVAHVNDLNDFYLHSDLIRESLGKLGQELYDEYSESLTKSLGINEILQVGDYCACPSESEDWYRGLIRQLDSNGHAIVFKLDYGDVQCIPIQFLQPLQKRFYKLHRLAFHCSLVNLIKPINGWSIDAIEEFRSRLTTTFLFAKFINYNEIRDLSEVEITEKNSKTPLNKDFVQYQIERSILLINDKFVYKYIPMEILDSTQLHQIRILYYISPSRFYVYLREKINSHISFQIDLQNAIQNLRAISSPVKYQLVAAQDNHAIWHRAVILDWNSDSLKVSVYFTDIGQRESISINNIRPLPEEFQGKPAFAIPCRLYKVCPIDGNEQSIWKSDDPVHDEIIRLMIHNITCKVCAKQDQICYDVEIEIPKVGDLSAFLFDKNLISRTTMNQPQRLNFNSTQGPQQSYVRAQLHLSGMSPSRPPQPRSIQQNDYYNSSNTMLQQPQTRTIPGLQNPTVQQSLSTSTNIGSSLNIPNVPPNNGYYKITQVHSAIEFYGLSQFRESELEGLSKYLEDYYNNSINDQSLSVNFYMEGAPCAIQQGDKYHRVTIKHRESESRVLVKLVDRGDEIIVDTSELLQLDKQCSTIPAFAQPFRLRGYDESQSSANITRILKKLIFNQRVRIEQQGSIINGFYPVEVILNDNQSVIELLLSSDKNSLVKSPITNNRPNFNQSQYPHIESQVFNNSNKHRPTMGQDVSGRANMSQRTNETLPAPQKILTGPPRTQPGRFGGGNQAFSAASSSNEQIPRFSNTGNRNQQQSQTVVEPTSSNSMWNSGPNAKPSFSGNNNIPSQPSFGRQQSGGNQRTDDNKISMTNNPNRFSATNHDNQPSSFEQKRSSGSGYTYDDRSEKHTSGNTFQQSNDGPNESGFRRGGFSNHGGGDRGGHSGFGNRNMGRNNEDNNNENSPQFSGGFSRRPGGFNDRGGRGGHFQDRNRGDDHNENSMQRSQDSTGNRGGFYGGRGGGGFQNRRDQGESGDFGRRGGFGDRGGSQRGRGFGGDRGGRGGFPDRDNSGLRLSSANNSSTSTGNSWSSIRTPAVNFEAGDRFIENEMPKEAFKFVISHIETANDFYIQLLSKGDELSKLSEILQTEYKQSPEASVSSCKINQAYLAKSSDQCWYRAMVLSTGLTKIKIRFIDFGDTTYVDSNTIRQISKKHCIPAPYAYRCTLKNAEVVKNISTESFINKCAGKEFQGKLTSRNSDGKFILESNDLLTILLGTNAIKLKSEVTFKRIKCLIAHIEPGQQTFYIQDDEDTVGKIEELVKNEDANTPALSLDEVKQLEANAVVIAIYEDGPFRAIIQSDESDENINVRYIDYGNTGSCPKISLKRCSEQLSSYPHQSKQCQLYGIASNEIDKAFKYLEEHSDSETLEIAIVNEKDGVNNVLVYVDNECVNEKFGYDPNLIDNHDTSAESEDQSSTTTATTVKEQERPVSVAEEQTKDDVLPTNESTSVATNPEENLSEIEEISPKYRRGFLTHIEETKPYVYLQLIPESDVIMEQINKLIKTITDENKHNSSYEISDHVIAQFSLDDDYYRARIESYSTSSELYTVYFLDYGNTDENVPIENLYSYSDELKQIEPQAHGYLLDNITSETWTENVRSFVAEKLNDIIQFYIVDENNSIIHMKFDNENDIYNIKENTEQINSSTKTFTANISATDNDCFYIHILPDGNLHACEMDEILQTCQKEHKDQWAINDLCFVSNEENKYYRGQILAIDDNKYDVKCIDYGNIIQNISNEHLYVLPDEDIYKQSPLAHKCRLFGVDDVHQTKAIEDVIKDIQPIEHVTITIENDENDQCLFVTLVRENNEIVNNQYLCDNIENENKQESDNDENDQIIIPNAADSAVTADVEPINNSEQSTTEMDFPQTEHALEVSDTTEASAAINTTDITSVSNNQTIDFGENDPATMIKDETNNSISSN